MRPQFATHTIGGVPIARLDQSAAADTLISLALSGEAGADVHLCNADSITTADANPELKAVLRQATLNLPDGMSVVLASKLAGRDNVITERVAGPDLFEVIWDRGQASKLRHYLLGSTPEVLSSLHERMQERYPDAVIAGTESPPFRPFTAADYDEIAERVKDSGAQIVWVGLGTPKQDFAAAELSRRVPAVFAAVGAAFDFSAGSLARAPRWMQKYGLEWLYRLASEPRRLWRRYLLGLPRFAVIVLRGRLRAD